MVTSPNVGKIWMGFIIALHNTFPFLGTVIKLKIYFILNFRF